MTATQKPNGTTACKWDTIIPLEPLWNEYNRIIKDNGAIALFGNEPFTSKLIVSNLKGFKYRWDWNKKITEPSFVIMHNKGTDVRQFYFSDMEET